MKRILLYAVFLGCIIYSCKPSKKAPSQTGVYKLSKLTVNSGGKDSVYARTQIKIYTDNYFAYASMAPDSSVGFGVGSYKPDTGSSITETNIYSSLALDSPRVYHLLVTRKDSTYTQVIPMTSAKGVKYSLTEVYNQLTGSDTTKLDGVWKMSASYTVKGKDTVKTSEVQYKAFWGGHFMFMHRYPVDNTNQKFKNGFGYGDFSLKSDTLSEENAMSSHTALLNRKFAIKITFKGNDEYSQVITDAKTNEQSVEIYKRMK